MNVQQPTTNNQRPTPNNRLDEARVLWEVAVCRGKEGNCPFALTALSHLKDEIEEGLHASGWDEFFLHQQRARTNPHHRLSIALAACPNACSRPQIQDIGLIAALRPEAVLETCDACGQCETTCREGAIFVEGDRAQLRLESCVACGECVSSCPIDAIKAGPLSFRIMVGGHMGRHPEWAIELPGHIAPEQVSRTIGCFVSMMMSEARTGERVSDFVGRVGRDRIWEAVRECGRTAEYRTSLRQRLWPARQGTAEC